VSVTSRISNLPGPHPPGVPSLPGAFSLFIIVNLSATFGAADAGMAGCWDVGVGMLGYWEAGKLGCSVGS